ncbi:MAG: TerD family protein, partial [Lachnospiraceae bacterium]|nr:TerD family protein [Lachnospiraceae bacterium]
SLVPPTVTRIAFTCTIYEAEKRHQNFGQVSNAFIRIYNEENGEELLRYDLGEDFSIETAVVFGEVYRNGEEWKFNAIGSGYQGGLAALCANYGVEVG